VRARLSNGSIKRQFLSIAIVPARQKSTSLDRKYEIGYELIPKTALKKNLQLQKTTKSGKEKKEKKRRN